jgi:hypothetical protein
MPIRMKRREPGTPEQAWCGEWYDCPVRGCGRTVLVPSDGLRAQLEAMRGEAAPDRIEARRQPEPDDPASRIDAWHDRHEMLRDHAGGAAAEPMTAEQREWCRAELRRLDRYCEPQPGPGAGDPELARSVLRHWSLYARDKL